MIELYYIEIIFIEYCNILCRKNDKGLILDGLPWLTVSRPQCDHIGRMQFLLIHDSADNITNIYYLPPRQIIRCLDST